MPMPDWERRLRDVLAMSSRGLPRLTTAEIDSRVERERNIRQWIDAARSQSSIEANSRLLFGDGQSEAQTRLLADCHPLVTKDAPHGIILFCLLRIQPLNHWPADVVRILGPSLLYHPFVVGGILKLAEIAADPRTFVNRTKPELFRQRGIRATIAEAVPGEDPSQPELRISGVRIRPGDPDVVRKLDDLTPGLRDKILADDYEPAGLADFARKQVLRVGRLLVARVAPATKIRRRLRTLRVFDAKRRAGLTEKKAVAELAREEGRPDAAVRADIQHAREELGLRSRMKRSRGTRHRIS